MRKSADKVIAPVLLDNPALSHADIIPKTRLLYQFYCINDPSFPDSAEKTAARYSLEDVPQTFDVMSNSETSFVATQEINL